MAETIESFVEKLQKDGVEAGQAEAQKLLAGARAEAERIVSDAKEKASGITDDALAQAERTIRQGTDDLELAGRDVLLRLHEAVARALRAVLARAAEAKMKDKQFLENLIRDVVMQYARKDAEGDRPIEVQVSDEMLDAVTAWATGEMAKEAEGPSPHIDLTGALKAAGFEYSSSGGTVEVTAESIAGVLTEMIAPRLREIIKNAAERPE